MLAIIATVVFLFLSKQVLGQKTIEFDTHILQYFLSIQNSSLTLFFVTLAFIGKPTFLVIVDVLFSLFLWTKNKISMAIVYFIIGNGAAGFNLFLKSFLGRERPALWDRIVEVKHLSYPSAHAMNSVVVYGLICYYLMNQFKPWRWLIFACTFLLVILIGLSRLYLGVHWPTDIIAGYIMGFVWLSIAIILVEFVKSSTNNQVDKKSTN
jgi:undecaprenyl-diphosphatase